MARDFVFKVKNGEALPPKDPNGYRLILDDSKGSLHLMGSDGLVKSVLDENVFDYAIVRFNSNELSYDKDLEIHSLEKYIEIPKKLEGKKYILPVQLIEYPMSIDTRMYGRDFWISDFNIKDYYGVKSINLMLSSKRIKSDEVLYFTFLILLVGNNDEEFKNSRRPK